MTDISTGQGYVGLTTRAAGNPDAIRDRMIESMTLAFPDVVIVPGTWLWHHYDAVAEEMAASELVAMDAADVANDQWANSYLGIARASATRAIGTVTVTAVDGAAHTWPAGSPMTIDSQLFVTVEDAIVIGTETGVRIVAQTAGSAGNVSGDVLDQGALAWVDEITLDAPTTLGSDLQDLADYRADVQRGFRILGSAATPGELVLIALNQDDIARALWVRGYVPGPPVLTGVPNAGTMFVCNSLGEDPGSASRGVLQATIEAQRIEGLVNAAVLPPTYTTVPATATVTVRAGYDPDDVQAACEAAVESLLSPANFLPNPVSGENAWAVVTTVYRSDLDAALKAVDGVLQVTDSAVNGGASMTLTGPAPLPQPGTITITIAS